MKKNVNVDALWTVMRMLESEQTEEALAEVISTMLSVLKAESAAVWLKNEGDGHVYCVSSAGDVSSTGYSIEAGAPASTLAPFGLEDHQVPSNSL